MTNPLSAMSPLSGLTELLSQEMAAKEMQTALTALFRTTPPEALAEDPGFEALIAQARAGERQVFLKALASVLRKTASRRKSAARPDDCMVLRMLVLRIDHDPSKTRQLRKSGYAYTSLQERQALTQAGLADFSQSGAAGLSAETAEIFSGKGLGVEKVARRQSATGVPLVQKTFVAPPQDLERLFDSTDTDIVAPWLTEPFLYRSGLFERPWHALTLPELAGLFVTDQGRLHLLLRFIDNRHLGKSALADEHVILAARATAEMNRQCLEDAAQPTLARLPQVQTHGKRFVRAITDWWSKPALSTRRARKRVRGAMGPGRELYERNGRAFFAERFPAQMDALDATFAAVPRLAASARARPLTLCHMDTHLGNLRLAGDRILFLDWGNAAVAPLGTDMGKLLAAIATHQAAALDPARILLALDSYLEQAPEAGGRGDLAAAVLMTLLSYHLPRSVALFRGTLVSAAGPTKNDGRRLSTYVDLAIFLHGLTDAPA